MIAVGADTHTHPDTQTERVLQALLDVGQKENSFVNYSINHRRRTLKNILNNIRGYCNKPIKQKRMHIL